MRSVRQGQITVMLIAACVWFATAQSVYVPQELEPWKKWVLRDHQDLNCPHVPIDTSERICVWPARLSLSVEQSSARFTLQVTAYRQTLVLLPGDSITWPYAVTVNGRDAPVVSTLDLPGIPLDAGTYSIAGKFRWENLPTSLQVPQGCGIIDLTINGKPVSHPAVDRNAVLWFTRQGGEIDTLSRDNIDVKIYRKLVDGVPIRIISRLRLKVSGQDRETVLGRFLPDSSEIITLSCELPARIEPDGNIRIQVRAGTWEISLESRRLDHNPQFSMTAQTPEWPKQELWAFEATPEERTVTINGAPSIDPSQTNMPAEWQQLPVYLLEKGTTLLVNEEYRGDCVPEANSLALDRSMWLDFDGSGYTVEDRIQGNITRPSRLTVAPACTLGSITLNEVPQLVTTIGDSKPGIEVQQGQVNLKALSRIGATRTLPAIGWNEVCTRASTSIHLPPGWSVLHVSGGDQVYGSWVGKWTLWDFFLILIMVISIARICNLGWAGVALGIFILTFHTENAPRFIWLACIAFVALHKAFSKGRLYQVTALVLLMVLAIAGISTVNFSLGQLRQALFPQLEHSDETGVYTGEKLAALEKQYEDRAVAGKRVMRSSILNDEVQQARNYAVYDATAKIQTGPGLPDWKWNQVSISWNGPVEPDQTISIMRAGPLLNRTGALARVIGVCMLLGLFIRLFYKRNRQYPLGGAINRKAAALSMIAGALFFGLPGDARAELPNETMLEELKTRLIAAVDSIPGEVAVESGTLAMRDDWVTIRLSVSAARLAALALPGARDSWRPARITVNGRDATALWVSAEGTCYCAIDRGKHIVTLSGRMEGGQNEIVFPGQVHNFSIETPQVHVFGLANGRIPGGALRIERPQQAARAGQEAKLLPEPAPAFVEVSRSVVLDKEWSIRTIVRRISPKNGPIRLTVPLVAGESIISAGTRDSAGMMTVYLTRDQDEAGWQSVLPQNERVALVASLQHAWTEIWALESTPRWHVETEGIASIKKNPYNPEPGRIWRPRPGDSVIIKVSVPEPVAGRTLTIRNVTFDDTWGSKTNDAALSLELLSSQADHLLVALPPKAVLGKVTIDGQIQIAAMEKGKVSVPVHPGEQTVSIAWKGYQGTSIIRTTPAVSLGRECANIHIQSQLPRDRWLVFVRGPLLGPALLFWPICIALLVLSLILGRIRIVPLRWYHWFIIALGMSTIDNIGGVLLVPWFLLLAYRRKTEVTHRYFNAMQVLVVLLTLGALGSLIATIPIGLLSSPDMQIAGNGSSSYTLKWYSDLSNGALPQALMVSLPMWVYRTCMLAWSLWVALCIIRWIRWGWESFSINGLWHQKKLALKPAEEMEKDKQKK